MVMSRLIKIGALILSTLMVVVGLSSCGGVRSDEPLVEDVSFPRETGETTVSDADQGTSDEEAEVLKLLGITKEPQPAEEQKPVSESDLSQLQSELSQRDVEIENLKAAIAEKDRQIQNLERMKAEKQQAASKAPSSQPAAAGKSSSFANVYTEALALYNARKYQQALAMFDDLLARNESNDLVDNAQYWKGECYYGLRDYNQAALEFQKVFMFSNSNKLDDAQLKLGLCYLRLGDRDRARIEFNKVIENYPDSEYVARAQTYLSRL